MDYRHKFELIVICVAILSCASSLFVLLTYIMFKEMRKKVFMRLICCISLADLCLNVGSAFGFPDASSPLCWIQGIAQNYFTVVSWFWTTVLSYSVYSIIMKERIVLNFTYAHLFCWGFPLVMNCLILITDNYGTAPVSYQWCIIVDKPGGPWWTANFWAYASFFVWFFVCFALMVLWAVQIMYRIVWLKSVMSEVVQKTYGKVWLYPIAMIVCWTLYYVMLMFPGVDSNTLVGLSMIAGMCSGICSSLIFFVKSDEARYRWSRLICGNPNPQVDDGSSARLAMSAIPMDFEEEQVNYADFVPRESSSGVALDSSHSFRPTPPDNFRGSVVLSPMENMRGSMITPHDTRGSTIIRSKKGVYEGDESY